MSHIQDDAIAALAVAARLTSLDLSGCLSLSDAGTPRPVPLVKDPGHSRLCVMGRMPCVFTTECSAVTRFHMQADG